MSKENKLPEGQKKNRKVVFFEEKIQPLADEIYRLAEEAGVSFAFHMDLDVDGKLGTGMMVTSQYINHDEPPFHMIRFFKTNDQ